MQRYDETKAYTGLIANLNVEVAALEALQTQLAGIKRNGIVDRKRTIEEQKRLNAAKSKLKTKRNKLVKVANLNIQSWDLLNILQEAEGTTWTPEEAATWHKELAAHEGRGEKALRIRHSLPQISTTQDCDLVQINEEVKNLQGRRADGKFLLQDIQTGKAGRQAYCMWMMLKAESGSLKSLSFDARLALGTGELSASWIYGKLPVELRTELHAVLAPLNVLGGYDAVNGTTRIGFIRIPKRDCNDAWSLECVTKMGPKYVLKKEYIVKRLKRTLLTLLPAYQQANVASK